MTIQTYLDAAREIAAHCWCDTETKDRVMDPQLAEAVARRIAAWMDTAAMHSRNEQFYQNLLDDCANNLGPLKAQAFIQDDGGVVDEPLRIKIPELVARLAEFDNSVPNDDAAEIPKLSPDIQMMAALQQAFRKFEPLMKPHERRAALEWFSAWVASEITRKIQS